MDLPMIASRLTCICISPAVGQFYDDGQLPGVVKSLIKRHQKRKDGNCSLTRKDQQKSWLKAVKLQSG